MARSRFRYRSLAAVLSVGAGLTSAAACGNGTQSSGAGGSGGLPTGTAGSPITSAGAGAGTSAAGSSAEAGRGGAAAVAGGGSNLAGSGNVAGSSAGGNNPPGAAGSSGAGSGNAGSSGKAGGSGSAGGPAESGAPPSCATSGPGRTNCGASGNESCCTSLPVSGGTYSRTYTNMGSGATGKADPATLSSFRLDKYETTVARFREYVKYLENGGSAPAAASGKHTHLNGGMGLADSGKPGSFEPGWDAAWNSRIPSGAGATAKWKTALTSSSGSGGCKIYGSWTDQPGNNDLLPITCTS